VAYFLHSKTIWWWLLCSLALIKSEWKSLRAFSCNYVFIGIYFLQTHKVYEYFMLCNTSDWFFFCLKEILFVELITQTRSNCAQFPLKWFFPFSKFREVARKWNLILRNFLCFSWLRWKNIFKTSKKLLFGWYFWTQNESWQKCFLFFNSQLISVGFLAVDGVNWNKESCQ